VSSISTAVAHIIEKDRLSIRFRRSLIKVAAAVQSGITIPPLPSIRRDLSLVQEWSKSKERKSGVSVSAPVQFGRVFLRRPLRQL